MRCTRARLAVSRCSMNTWLLEPRDPLIARDGRPFRAEPGARARTLPFPLPSTITGAFRSRAGGDPFDIGKLPALLRTWVHGPWLVELDESDGVRELYLPAPADIAYSLASEGSTDDPTLQLHRLVPITMPEDCRTNVPTTLEYLVGLPTPFDGKPPRAPSFFRWSHYSDWLQGKHSSPFTILASKLGLSLQRETRFHVALENDRRTAKDEALFVTEGLCFESCDRRLALLVRTSLDLEPGIGRVGGEGRLSVFRKTAYQLPQCPEAIVAKIVESRACRLLLVTPGLFQDGFLPKLDRIPEAQASIVAAAVPSSGTVSGFDLAKNEPKPTRRFVPAGSVYFVRFGSRDEGVIREWVNAHWFGSLCEIDDQRAGWGLATLGCWDGEPVSLSEVRS